jgi:hypothetical protein
MLRCSNPCVTGCPSALKEPLMSPQLTLSSLFCVLALAGLCVMTGARDLAGINAPVAAAPHVVQAEALPGPLEG